MNRILSFDIEEWYIEKVFKEDDPKKYQAYDDVLRRILDLLEAHSTKATFFCLGGVAEHFPAVIREISNRGHEIGCHSNSHRWVNKMTPEEFREDTSRAIAVLENVCGKKVKSYRAPAFSIGEANKWAFEILAECGIKNDASVFPGARDFGGFPAFSGGGRPCKIEYAGCSINEFPISLTRIPVVGKSMAYSGGGYFRVIPLSFVEKTMRESDYTMCYFHVLDLLDIKSKFMTREEYERYFKEKGSFIKRMIRYSKSNIGRKRTFRGLSHLLDLFEFSSIEEVAASENLPQISI